MCRLAEEEIIKHITTTDASIKRGQALSLLRTWYLGTPRVKGGLASAGPAQGKYSSMLSMTDHRHH